MTINKQLINVKTKLKRFYLLTLILLIKKMPLFDFDTMSWQI